MIPITKEYTQNSFVMKKDETPVKFEVRPKGELYFGIWNNDMLAWQFVGDWMKSETVNKEKAEWYCSMMNHEVICHECKRREAITDYNGHGYLVCKPCDEHLNNYFDEEYK